MMTPAVELLQIRHNYGNRVALDGITLAIDQACVFALLGPNGGGKTTLFRIISTLIDPTGGTARVLGDDVTSQRSRVRSNLGIVFQSPSLDPYLSVSENMMHQGHLYGLSGDDLKNRCRELLTRFDVLDRAGERVKNLSGGLQRRVELAKSLLHKPKVLLLDEPGTGLDPGARANLMDLLLELRTGDAVTSLLTSHFIDEADRCDRVAIIDKGKLIAQGSPADLKSQIGGDVITIGTRDPVALGWQITSKFGIQTEVADGRLRMERPSAHLFIPQLIEAFPGLIDTVAIGRPTLADFFHRVTGHSLNSQD